MNLNASAVAMNSAPTPFGVVGHDRLRHVVLVAAVEYGAAHGALAMTTPGDTSMVSATEVEAIMSGKGARVIR